MTDQSPEAHAFLQKHVYANANQLIQYLLENNDKSFGEEWHEELFCHYYTSTENLDLDSGNDYCPNEDPEPELREPFEFWIVSDDFAHYLQQENALLTNHFGFWIWGRETTGQSIILDYIFQKVWQQFKEKSK